VAPLQIRPHQLISSGACAEIAAQLSKASTTVRRWALEHSSTMDRNRCSSWGDDFAVCKIEKHREMNAHLAASGKRTERHAISAASDERPSLEGRYDWEIIQTPSRARTDPRDREIRLARGRRGSVASSRGWPSELSGFHQPRVCSRLESGSPETANPFIELGTSSLTSSNTLGSL
jgi:hypothetical protein